MTRNSLPTRTGLPISRSFVEAGIDQCVGVEFNGHPVVEPAEHLARGSKKRWSDLSPQARTAIVLGGTLELIVTTIALRDLMRRPAENVRAAKLLWLVGCFVQPIGPLAYLAVGRRRPTR